MNVRTSLPLFLSTSIALLFSGCIFVLDGDGHWDGTYWHGGHHRDTIRGSGVSKSESRPVSEFRRIEVTCSCDVSVAVGTVASLNLTGDDNLLPYIVTEVREGTLFVEMKSGSYSPQVGLNLVATAPALESVVVRGSSDVDVAGLAGDRFSIEITGSGDAHATGKVGTVTARISGSGDLHLADLEAREANAEISGSGDIEVWATEALGASVSGSGDVTYKGDPTRITKSVAGSGHIRKR
jgi:hypothetical protein